MENKILSQLNFEKLLTLYGAINEICSDYARMTDGYSLATGDNKFENLPRDIALMIKDRQEFFGYKTYVQEELKDRIKKIMNGNEKN